MSFSFCPDYLVLATSLVVDAHVATDEARGEALARAATSRAYYAAFHAAQAQVFALQRELDPFFYPKKDQDRTHDRIWECYTRTGRALAGIGTTGRELKQIRKHADYDCPPQLTVEKAELAILMAQKVADRIAALAPRDVKSLADYLARNPL